MNAIKLISGITLAAFAAFAGTDVPEVSSVEYRQNTPGSRLVTVTYAVSNAPAVVTLDVLTNGVSIGDENIQFLAGDVNRLVGIGPHTITWQADKSWPGNKITENIVQVKVCAWATNAPPDYLVADLLTGAVRYYASSDALPGGVTNDAYKTDKIVMRRISAAGVEWDMGATALESYYNSSSKETNQVVTLPDDYYIGVYEVTQRQWYDLTGTNSQANFHTYYNTYPGRAMENVSYVEIRENNSANYSTENTAYQCPNGPAPASFLGRLRTLTGIPFDLPSEAQWEYACRAESGRGINVWNDGSPYVFSGTTDSNLNKLGRYGYNGGYSIPSKWSCPADVTPDNGTAVVGSYAPNGWGLYDMHGNVGEWCLDWFADYYVYPTGHGEVNTTRPSVVGRVMRGGAWDQEPRMCRSACRYGNDTAARAFAPTSRKVNVGFRLAAAATVPAK